MLSVSPAVLKRASPKLLQRMGYQATNAAQTNEGHGFGASGKVDEPAGATVDFRHRRRQRQVTSALASLGADSSAEDAQCSLTLCEKWSPRRGQEGTARQWASAALSATLSW